MTQYIFVHLIDKKPVGANLAKRIPLHLTLLPWFTAEAELAAIIDKTERTLSSLPRVRVQATAEDYFGPRNKVQVMRLSKTPELVRLHNEIKSAMEEIGAKVESKWLGADKWQPHVTHKPEARLYSGDELVIKDVDLIKRESQGGDRIILHRFSITD